jgi:glutathione S-transferase
MEASMAETIRLLHLAGSSNSMKVRIALNYKGLSYEKVPVDPQDRTEVVRVSGQPLTPVLVHGDRVVFDSASIVRYLDANFRDTKPLFSADYAEMKEIERWEIWARTELAEPVSMVYGQMRAERPDEAVLKNACELLNRTTAKIEDRLATAQWLVGDRMTAADATVAPVVNSGMLSQEMAASSPFAAFFARHLRLGEGRQRTRAWVSRVMAYDR